MLQRSQQQCLSSSSAVAEGGGGGGRGGGLKLCELRPSVDSNLSTTFIILEKGQASRVNEAAGQMACVALVADATAAAHLQLCGSECDAFQPSDIIRLSNGTFSYHNHNHNMVLRAGPKGSLEKIGHFTMVFVENPNMSKIQWIPHPSNSKLLTPRHPPPSSPSPTKFWSHGRRGSRIFHKQL